MNIDEKDNIARNEHQNRKHLIIKNIISILEQNNLSINEAKDILYITSKTLGKQLIKSSL